MKDAIKGFVRAAVILFGLLLVLNLLKPVLFAKEDNNDISGYEIKNDTDDIGIEFDNKNDYSLIYQTYSFKGIEEVFGKEFKSYYYENKKFDDEFYLYTAIVNLARSNFVLICNNTVEYDEKEVTDKIEEMYGKVNYSNISYTSKDENLIINYDADNKKYSVTNKRCLGIDASNGYIETELLGGKDSENMIEIYERAHLIKPEISDGITSYINYKGVTESTGISKDEKYSIYKYVFEKDNNEYHLIDVVQK